MLARLEHYSYKRFLFLLAQGKKRWRISCTQTMTIPLSRLFYFLTESLEHEKVCVFSKT